MKALLLNGSPRKGNIFAALGAIEEGLETINGLEVENIRLQEMNIAPCMGCDACKGNGGSCIIGDDGNVIIEKLYEADILIFGTPVYWWGMTAQLKIVLDRMYSKSQGKLGDKKIGYVIIGGDDTSNIQYELISKQFDSIAKYLDWKVVFAEKYSAYGKDEIADNQEKMDYFRELGKNFK